MQKAKIINKNMNRKYGKNIQKYHQLINNSYLFMFWVNLMSINSIMKCFTLIILQLWSSIFSKLSSRYCLISSFLVSHLDRLQSMEVVFRTERDGGPEEGAGLGEVLDGDEDLDGVGQTVGLQVDVLLAVGPQQVRSHQGEPAGSHNKSDSLYLCRVKQGRGGR